MKGFIKTTETGEVLFAPNFVSARDYELLAEKHEEYTYPVDGWMWVEDYEEPATEVTEADYDLLLQEHNLIG